MSLDLSFHALSDPTRRLMVQHLCAGPASVSELAAPLHMSLPAVVQHVNVLEKSGLILTEKVGRVRTCRIDLRQLYQVEQWIVDRRMEWSNHLDRLGEYLLHEMKRKGDA